MIIETCAQGKKTTLTISKNKLSEAANDLKEVRLPLVVSDCDVNEHGTTVTLRGLNQNLHYPNAERLKQILVRDGRVVGFPQIG